MVKSSTKFGFDKHFQNIKRCTSQALNDCYHENKNTHTETQKSETIRFIERKDLKIGTERYKIHQRVWGNEMPDFKSKEPLWD